MNRRGFLKFLGIAAAGAAVEQLIPNGRVWSFPKEIKIYNTIGEYADYVNFSDLFAAGIIHPFMVADIMKDDFAMAILSRSQADREFLDADKLFL